MQKADYLLRLMKQRTDALVASDEKLQQFLMWVSQKSISVKVPYKPAAVRAFYFALYHPRDRTLVPTLVRALDKSFFRALVPALVTAADTAVDGGLDHALVRVLARARDGAHDRALDPELRQALQQLKEERLKQWWQTKAQAWSEQLRTLIISHRNVGHDWQFSKQQQVLLQQYYDANTLVVDCLYNASNVTPAVRSHIEDTLLLPIAEIEKHK
jgi:predicted NACHT family NTPase